MEQRRRKPQLGDPDYDAKAFVGELSGGSLRWVATILGALNAVLVVCVFSGLMSPPVMFGMSPTTGRIVLVVALLVWIVLALINWLAWKRQRAGDDAE